MHVLDVHSFCKSDSPNPKAMNVVLELSKPAFFNVAERRVLNYALVKDAPLSKMNSEPGALL